MRNKMSITKAQKLAGIHGPFVRFTPDGNEAVEGAIKAAEEADLKDNAEFDKVRQQAQQHEANAKKARGEATAANTQLSAANSQVESLKADLAVAQAKADTAGVKVELNEEDYTDTDLNLVRSIKAIEKQLESKDVEINNLKKKASDFESSKVQQQAKSAQEEAYQELLTDMDVDYGPEFRNAAVKEFEKLNSEGKVTGGPAKATRILEKCYKNAVKAANAKQAEIDKGKVTLDGGSGGGTAVNYGGVELKAGSLEDVTAQAGKLLNKPG